jgi:peptidyl-prolyl cis-trans isomerase A (cyclophilin A)
MNKQLDQTWRAWAGLVATALALTACGGGGGGPSVSNMAATNAVYGRTMTITISGAGLNTPDLQLGLSGPCSDGVRTTSTLEYQAAFTCRVDGVGTVTAAINDAQGTELGRLRVNIPMPQVSITVAQGSRSGTFVVELDPAAAPVTALNFIRYVNASFYRDTIFHRVLANQIVQGGQYDAELSLRPALFDPIKLESDNGLKNLRGTIAMARTQVPDSATAQFYINVIDNPAFDRQGAEFPGYAVFGRVVSGLDVVDEIAAVPVATVSNEFPALPLENVVMTAVVQTR